MILPILMLSGLILGGSILRSGSVLGGSVLGVSILRSGSVLGGSVLGVSILVLSGSVLVV
jgi:hypothetical protein